MTFDDKYPAAEVRFRTPNAFFKGSVVQECCACERKTQWFHIGALLYFCSEECFGRFLDKPRCSPSSTAEYQSG